MTTLDKFLTRRVPQKGHIETDPSVGLTVYAPLHAGHATRVFILACTWEFVPLVVMVEAFEVETIHDLLLYALEYAQSRQSMLIPFTVVSAMRDLLGRDCAALYSQRTDEPRSQELRDAPCPGNPAKDAASTSTGAP